MVNITSPSNVDMNMVNITSPSDDEIKAWWNWAAQFNKQNSPFQIGWGNSGKDLTNFNQPIEAKVYCVSCTAGSGGRDSIPRPLKAAVDSAKDILVPVFVAEGSDVNVARRQLGRDPAQPQATPAVEFFVDGTPREFFYRETDVGNVNFVEDNSFEEQSGTQYVWSAGFWAKVSPNINNIQFGGNGGQLSPNDPHRFDTGVIYSL